MMSASPRGRLVTALPALLRVQEWPKNLFVFAPLLFSGRLDDAQAVATAVLTAGALCPLSSVVYILNDLRDIPRDRQHPTKRFRPMASGQVSPASGAAAAAGCLAAGALCLHAARVPPAVWALTGLYLAVSTVYTLYVKRKVIVDVLTIAVGYVLRVLIGGAAIGVAVTHWLILCAFLLATFLGFSKRRHELATLGAESRSTRPVLNFYTDEFLDRMSMLTLGVTLTCYILYTIAPETVARFGTTALVYSSLIVMFALFRYLFLIHVKKLGSPVEALYGDRQLVMACILWVLYVVLVVYTWPKLHGGP